MSALAGTKALQLWCRQMTADYDGVDIRDMSKSWKDGLAFCALVHRLQPGLINFTKLRKEDVLQNNQLAFSMAERHLGIPALLDAEDMAAIRVPDRLSVLTYVSQFYEYCKRNPSGAQGATSSVNVMPQAPTSPVARIARDNSAKSTKQNKGMCLICSKKVYILERYIVEGQLYHRACYKIAMKKRKRDRAKEPSMDVCSRCYNTVSKADSVIINNTVFHDTCQPKDDVTTDTQPEVTSNGSESLKENNMTNSNGHHHTSSTVSTDSVDDSQTSVTPPMAVVSPRPRTDDPRRILASVIANSACEERARMAERASSPRRVESQYSSSSRYSEKPKSPNRFSETPQSPRYSEKPQSPQYCEKPSSPKSPPTTNGFNATRNLCHPSSNSEVGLDKSASPIEPSEPSGTVTDDNVQMRHSLPVSPAKSPVVAKRIGNSWYAGQTDSQQVVVNHSLQHIRRSIVMHPKRVSPPKVPRTLSAKASSPPVAPKPKLVRRTQSAKVESSVIASEQAKGNAPANSKGAVLSYSRADTLPAREELTPLTIDVGCQSLKHRSSLPQDKERHMSQSVTNDTDNVDPIWVLRSDAKRKKKVRSLFTRPEDLPTPPPSPPISLSSPLISPSSPQLSPTPSAPSCTSVETTRHVSASLPPPPPSPGTNNNISKIEKPTDLKETKEINQEESSEKELIMEGVVDDTEAVLRSPKPRVPPPVQPRASLHRHTSPTPRDPSRDHPAESRDYPVEMNPFGAEDTFSSDECPASPCTSPSARPWSSPQRSTTSNSTYSETDAFLTGSRKSFRAPKPPRPAPPKGGKYRKVPAPKPPPVLRKVSAQEVPCSRTSIETELASLDVQQEELERKGRELEDQLRSVEGREEELLLKDWFKLVDEKNWIIRREVDLQYRLREHDLEDEHTEIEFKLRRIMSLRDYEKSDLDRQQEQELLTRLMTIVDRRNNIVDSVEQDRLRYEEEDKQFALMIGGDSVPLDDNTEVDATKKKKKKLLGQKAKKTKVKSEPKAKTKVKAENKLKKKK